MAGQGSIGYIKQLLLSNNTLEFFSSIYVNISNFTVVVS